MEWLEIFFVSFYAAELSNLIASYFHFEKDFSAWSITIWALIAGVIAFLTLHPHKQIEDKANKEDKKAGKLKKILKIALLTIIAWFIFGKFALSFWIL